MPDAASTAGLALPVAAPAPRGAPSPAAFRDAIVDKLTYMVAKDPSHARDHDWLVATALAVRDRVIDRWSDTTRLAYRDGRRRVYYLSLEFLIGRLLGDVLSNLGLTAIVAEALSELGLDLQRLRRLEPDAALGNGGLGRLAACLVESMSTLGIAAHGYGIRYDHGIFRQVMNDGWQHELPENWLANGNPWEFERPEVAFTIGFCGHVEDQRLNGTTRRTWRPAEQVSAVAFDTPIVGWRGSHVNALRLWSARALDPLDLAHFNRGEHVGALADRVRLEAISRVLYPGDDTPSGQALRLRQEFFFASASLQDLLRRHKQQHGELSSLADHATIQLNDTHAAIAIPEMMRQLVDFHGMPWELAWDVTSSVFNYTNHTLLPEALESWSVDLLGSLLPRHVEIIYAINAQHLERQRQRDGSGAALAGVSLVDERGERRIRMGHLAFVGARHVNGVSALHTDLMRRTVFRDLAALYPDRIVNVTNGISFRRWLHQANPALTRIIVEVVGADALDDPSRLAALAAHAGDSSLHRRLAGARRANKIALARLIAEQTGISADPDALFDVHIKRVHEYKRQLLNVLGTIALHRELRAGASEARAPRVKIFAGKAAASYARAKLIIKLINDVARTINDDPATRDRLRVVFLPNYNVSLAEAIIPAADVSEQISTAGLEASGTGNMKLALNGALTLGTYDGANLEIRDHVGAENVVMFGLDAAQVDARRGNPAQAGEAIAASPALDAVLSAIERGDFSPDDPARYADLCADLRSRDTFMVCADFDAYCAAQRTVDAMWNDPAAWWRCAVLNTANMHWFSSDRATREYMARVWNLPR